MDLFAARNPMHQNRIFLVMYSFDDTDHEIKTEIGILCGRHFTVFCNMTVYPK